DRRVRRMEVLKGRLRNMLFRELMAETLAMFVLMMFGCASMAQVKLTRGAKGEYLSVNMAFSLGVMSAMYIEPTLNPTVSLSCCVLGRLPWSKLLPYCMSQVLGAYIAAVVVFLVYYDAIMDYSGGMIMMWINPARDLGPRLLTLTAGWATEVFMCYNYWFWVPIVAPMVGAVLGSGLYLVFVQWHLPDSEINETNDFYFVFYLIFLFFVFKFSFLHLVWFLTLWST
uniref:Aquaporin 10b n=1 Tax=Salmo trutta TaxID=8032 RepID=A0A674DBZ3_SALTR